MKMSCEVVPRQPQVTSSHHYQQPAAARVVELVHQWALVSNIRVLTCFNYVRVAIIRLTHPVTPRAGTELRDDRKQTTIH